jgi:hypothetical protein
VGFWKIGLALGVSVAMLGSAAVAQANTNTSVNWSGYALHRPGVKFRRVSAEWREPSGTCQPSSATTYSAFWLGLGGYSLNSPALEQIGTEFDCTPTGHTVLSGWYELVPAPSRTLRMRVDPGDLVKALVRIAGTHVTVSLWNLTRGTSFHRTVTDRHVDISSAEWIAEAPSECLSISQCRILPLADFGSVAFTRTFAQTTRYGSGGISSRHWNHTKILLANTNGRRYVSGGSVSAKATPSGLAGAGKSFTITYAGTPPAAEPGSPPVSAVDTQRAQPHGSTLKR